MRLEITTSISGVEFDECYQARIADRLDGVEGNLINLENLKKSGQVAGQKTWPMLKNCLDLVKMHG
jgi:hypothetical protein